MFCVDTIVKCTCFVQFVKNCIFLFHIFVQNVVSSLAMVFLWIQTHFCLFETSITSLCVPSGGKKRRDVFDIQRHLYILNQTTSRTTTFYFFLGCLLAKQSEQLFQLYSFLLLLQTFLDSGFESQRIASRNRVILKTLHFLVELVQVFASKRRTECTQFIDYAAKGPYIALSSIALVVPDLGRSIIGSSSLRLSQTFSQFSCDIKVTDLGHIINGKEYICWFDVTMYHSHLVQILQTFKYSCSPFPDLAFRKGLAAIEAYFNFFSEITPMRQFHYESQFSFIFVKDGFSILHNVGMIN